MSVPVSMNDRIRIGVSSCLLGEKVRYDGQHKHDPWITDVLGRQFELVPVCPELELGLGVPREPIHLIRAPGRSGGVRLTGTRSETDHTDAMARWAERRIEELRALVLSGFVFKEGSPSCGVLQVPVWQGDQATRDGAGLFARAFRDALPCLPVEEAGRLADPSLRESFVERVLTFARLDVLGRERGDG